MEVDIHISTEIYLTKTSRKDKETLIAYLNDDELFNQTLRVPKPYTELDAENWFNYILTFKFLKYSTSLSICVVGVSVAFFSATSFALFAFANLQFV